MVFTNKEISAWNTQTWKKIYSIIKPDGTEPVYLTLIKNDNSLMNELRSSLKQKLKSIVF